MELRTIAILAVLFIGQYTSPAPQTTRRILSLNRPLILEKPPANLSDSFPHLPSPQGSLEAHDVARQSD